MMDPTIKAKWLEALRSGYYQQGQGRLHQGDQFCCLGVLCDVLKLPIYQDQYNEKYRIFRYKHEGADENDLGVFDRLPWDTREGLGITEDEESQLINMNDEGSSFYFIADHIEEKL